MGQSNSLVVLLMGAAALSAWAEPAVEVATRSTAVKQPSDTKQVEDPSFIETFEGNSNEGGWSYLGNPANDLEVIATEKGNGGSYLHIPCLGFPACLDTFAPQIRTHLGKQSEFTGNYRDEEVTMLGIDLIVHAADYSATGRPLTLMLRSDNGTSEDTADDLIAFSISDESIPSPGQNWRRFTFHIPSSTKELPAQWRILQGSSHDDADWNAVITEVDQVIYFYGDPDRFYLLSGWDLGIDNAQITRRHQEPASVPQP